MTRLTTRPSSVSPASRPSLASRARAGDRAGSSTIASTRASSRPRAHQVGARARPAQQPERLDQDALAGARLAGDRGQARSEPDLDLVNQREPGDLEQRQHGGHIFG
jgi:hypothetical protein